MRAEAQARHSSLLSGAIGPQCGLVGGQIKVRRMPKYALGFWPAFKIVKRLAETEGPVSGYTAYF